MDSGSDRTRKKMLQLLLKVAIAGSGLIITAISLTRYSTIRPILLGMVVGALVSQLYLILVFRRKELAQQLRRFHSWFTRASLRTRGQTLRAYLGSGFIVFILSLFLLLSVITLFWMTQFSVRYSIDFLRVGAKVLPDISELEISIRENRNDDNQFLIEEKILFSCDEFSAQRPFCNKFNFSQDRRKKTVAFTLPERSVTPKKKGLFLKEVAFSSSVASSAQDTVFFKLPDGTEASGPICDSNSCPEEIAVIIQDLPNRSFYAAKGVSEVDRDPYVQTETIRWETTDIGRGIVFVYIPSPFHHLNAVIRPLISVSSLSQWILTGLTAMFTIFMLPILSEMFREKMKGVVNKEPKHKRTIELVVSSRGDTKKIDLDN